MAASVALNEQKPQGADPPASSSAPPFENPRRRGFIRTLSLLLCLVTAFDSINSAAGAREQLQASWG
jgi:hypothetical protein